MNIILFKTEELGLPLEGTDPRSQHIREILGSQEGDILKGGVLDGPLIEITLTEISREQISYTYRILSQPSAEPYPITLIIGTPRPPTARRLIKDLTTLGVGRLIFTGTDLNEKSYLTSKLWTKGGYKDALIEGAQQAGCTKIAEIERFYSLKKSLESLPANTRGVFFEADKAYPLLDRWLLQGDQSPIAAALGPERGWTDREIEMLKEKGFQGLRMGQRILRTETAALSAASQIIQRSFL